MHVRSAGSAPVNAINPMVIEAMKRNWSGFGRRLPETATDDVVATADMMVSMGCGDACALSPGKRYLDWPR